MAVLPRTQLHFGRLALMVGIVIASVLFWETPALLPFKLLAVMGHETGHALASLIAGGSVEKVTLASNQSGSCLSSIPEGLFAKTLVYSAGYVGSALISVLLLALTFRFNARRLMLGAACVWLSLMAIFYARDVFTLGFCLAFAALFGIGAKWLPTSVVGALNLFLATFTALYAALDLKDDLWNGAVRAQSDAQLLANLTIVPAIIWALVWTVSSLLILAIGAWFAVNARAEAKATQPVAPVTA